MILSDEACKRLVQRKLYTTPRNLSHFLSYMFGANTAINKNVLDVGGGAGVLCLAACVQGARSGDCIDPEGDGSTPGTTTSFEANAQALSLTNARMIRTTFQDFEAPADKYDLIFIHNAINHLDEAACIDLQKSEEARDAYRMIFDKLRRLLRPNGRVIISDCGRSNAFGDRGIKSPLMPTIEWEKHQDPEVWVAAMEPSGFRLVRTQWSSFNSLGKPGRILGNRPAAYLLLSHFRIELVAV